MHCSNIIAQVSPLWDLIPNLPQESGGYKVLTDHSNNVYVCGYDSSYTNQPGAYKNLVLYKTDPAGNYIWHLTFSTYSSFGMVMDDSDFIYLDINGITKIDTSGNIVWQNNSIIPADTNYQQPVRGNLSYIDKKRNIYSTGLIVYKPNGQYDICLAKFDSTGNFLWNAVWTSYPPHITQDHVYGIEVDNQNNIYICGAEDYFASYGDGNAILLKYDANGVLKWEYKYSGIQSKNDNFLYLAIDSNQNIYLAGNENADNDYRSAMLLKIDSSKNLIWKINYSSPTNQRDAASSLKVDTLNNIYFSGSYYGTSIFLSKYSESGVLIWSLLQPPPFIGSYYINEMTIDHQGNVILIGNQMDSLFVSSINSNGVIGFLSKYPKGGGYGAKSVGIDQLDNILVTGGLQGSKMIILKYGNFFSGMNEISNLNSIKLFPNPSKGKFYINDNDIEINEIDIFDFKMTFIKSFSFTNHFDLSMYPAGIYFYTVKSKDGKMFYGKIIKL